jgi:hypothetical protein
MLGEELTRSRATRVYKIEEHRLTPEGRELKLMSVLIRQGQIGQTIRLICNSVFTRFLTGPVAAR